MGLDSFTIGVDVGGTFTDAVVLDSSGWICLGKDLSTYPDVSRGILASIEDAAKQVGIDLGSLLARTSYFLHSSTVSENMIVAGSGTKPGLITTKGFEDTLVMMRGGYGRWSGLTEEEIKDPVHTDKPPPLIPRDLIRGLNERIDYRGKVIVNLKDQEVRSAVKSLVDSGVKAIGVCLLWSIANQSHELAVKHLIRENNPGIYVATSREIAPVLGEYERTSSVALNAYLGPTVSEYIGHLQDILERKGFGGNFLVLLSHGGLVRPSEAREKPIGLIESGPVGGLVGSKFLGRLLGFNNIIAADMGGTTFKVGIISENMIDYQREPAVARYHYAFPKMDIISIGAGGGSVVWLEPRTAIPKVGPRSAGSSPGPICYGFGGEEPTITDIDLLLGYLDPSFFLGGRIKLNEDTTRRLFKEKMAEKLGLDVVDAAASIYGIANAQMYDLLHKVTVERGLDPTEYSMFSYGGAAGMHVAGFGSEIGVPTIVVPSTASVHGAFGLVSSDVAHDYTLTRVTRLPTKVDEVNEIFEKLHQAAMRQMAYEGFESDRVTVAVSADMRFRRQVHVVTTPIDTAPPLVENDLEAIGRRFQTLYEQKYGKGSAFTEAGMEIVTFRLRAVGALGKVRMQKQPLAGRDPKDARRRRTRAYFEKSKDYVETDVYGIDGLRPGNEVLGPAIILTPITTLVINPGQRASVDEYMNILIAPEGRSLQ